MSNTQKLTIIAINSRNGVSAKTGRPYSMHEAQCILTEGVADATGGCVRRRHLNCHQSGACRGSREDRPVPCFVHP